MEVKIRIAGKITIEDVAAIMQKIKDQCTDKDVKVYYETEGLLE